MIAAIRMWREGLIALLVASLCLLWIANIHSARKNDRLADRLAAAERSIALERAAIGAASARAAAEDAAHAARVERDQERISRETVSDYQKDIADLRRRADAVRLRSDEAGTDQDSGAGPPVPGVPAAAGRTDRAASQAGLPAADALIASEQAFRLRALQQWVTAQAEADRRSE